MSEIKKDPAPERKKPDTPRVEKIDPGILKSRDDKDLEGRIVTTMRGLGSKLTRKEILSLASKIEASASLDELRKNLESDGKIGKEIPEEALRAVMDLISQARELAESGLEELKLEVARIPETKEYEIHPEVYFSKKFPWVKRLEESELGKNLVIDVAGFLVGSIDSAISATRLLFLLLKDFFLLPIQVIRSLNERSEK